MPVRSRPSHPSLNHLKYQAKDLRKALDAHSPEAAQRIREFHPHFKAATDAEIFAAHFTLADAQLTIAREHGYASWTALKARVAGRPTANPEAVPLHERIQDPAFRRKASTLMRFPASQVGDTVRYTSKDSPS